MTLRQVLDHYISLRSELAAHSKPKFSTGDKRALARGKALFGSKLKQPIEFGELVCVTKLQLLTGANLS